MSLLVCQCLLYTLFFPKLIIYWQVSCLPKKASQNCVCGCGVCVCVLFAVYIYVVCVHHACFIWLSSSISLWGFTDYLLLQVPPQRLRCRHGNPARIYAFVFPVLGSKLRALHALQTVPYWGVFPNLSHLWVLFLQRFRRWDVTMSETRVQSFKRHFYDRRGDTLCVHVFKDDIRCL